MLLRIDTMDAGPVYIRPADLFSIAPVTGSEKTHSCITLIRDKHAVQFVVGSDADELAAMFEVNAKITVLRVN